MRKILAVLLSLLFLCSVMPIMTFAKDGGENQTIIYYENFEDADLGAYTDWTPVTQKTGRTKTLSDNCSYTVVAEGGNKKLVINNQAEYTGNACFGPLLTNNALSVIVPASVMDQYKADNYIIEYDFTMLTNTSGSADVYSTMLTAFNGDLDNFVMPTLLRAFGKGNGYGIYTGSFATIDSGTQLTNATWLSNLTGGDYSYNATSTTAMLGAKLSLQIRMSPNSMEVYASYNGGALTLISKVSGNSSYTTLAAITAGIGFNVCPQVSVAVDEVKVYTNSNAKVRHTIYSEDFEDADLGAYTDWTAVTSESKTLSDNCSYTVVAEDDNKKLVINNQAAYTGSATGTALTNNALSVMVPASVMDQYKADDYIIEYDFTMLTNTSGAADVYSTMLTAFNGDLSNFVMPTLLRAYGRGNGWAIKANTFTTIDTGTALSNMVWLSTVTGGAYSYNETSTDAFLGVTLSLQIRKFSGAMEVYASYDGGEWYLVSKVVGNATYASLAEITAGIGFSVCPQVSVALDNIEVYRMVNPQYICEHEYDNDCDTVCNLCGFVRETHCSEKAVLVGYQATAENTSANTFDFRLIGVLHLCDEETLADYKFLGFDIVATYTDGENPVRKENNFKTDRVYNSIHANDGILEYTAKDLGGDYIYALACTNIPSNVGDISLKVTAYYVTADGITVTCSVSQFTVRPNKTAVN